MIVLRCLSTVGTIISTSGTPAGQYLAGYDPEAQNGLGHATFTERLSGALLFPDFNSAIECYHTVPEARPVREDGRPNRPLTAFTMEFVEVELDRRGLPVLVANC